MSVLPGRIATAASAILLAVGSCPLPAMAAPAGVTIATHFQQLTLAPGGEAREALLWGAMSGDSEGGIDVVRYTVDYAGIAAFAEVELTEVADDFLLGGLRTSRHVGGSASSTPADGGCRASGTEIVCSIPTWTDTSVPLIGLGYFSVELKAGATAGTSGNVRVTASVGDGPESTSESPVRVGEGVNLIAEESDPMEVAAGETVEVDARVINGGDTVADGVMLYIGVNPEALADTSYSNCEYGSAVICTFDTKLQPSATYSLSELPGIRTPDDSIDGSRLSGEFTWTTATEWEDLKASWPDEIIDLAFGDMRPGTGDELTLVPATTTAGVPQVEIEPDDNTTELTATVAGGAVADFAALGAEVAAKAGDTVGVRVGRVNNGPGRLYPDFFENNTVPLEIRTPPNTYLEEGDGDCYAKDDVTRFLCLPRSAELGPGDREYIDFELRVKKKPGKPGSVETPELTAGADQTNNAAPIVVTVAAGDDELPITGPAGLLAIGTFLLMLGVIGRYFARRA